MKFTNADMIRRTTSMPTASLAAQRFESAVFAASTSWFQRTLLSEIYAGLLSFELPIDLGSKVALSLDAYAFEDPWSGAGRVELRGDVAVLQLQIIPSIRDAFRAVIGSLQPAEKSVVDGPVWESWCVGG